MTKADSCGFVTLTVPWSVNCKGWDVYTAESPECGWDRWSWGTYPAFWMGVAKLMDESWRINYDYAMQIEETTGTQTRRALRENAERRRQCGVRVGFPLMAYTKMMDVINASGRRATNMCLPSPLLQDQERKGGRRLYPFDKESAQSQTVKCMRRQSRRSKETWTRFHSVYSTRFFTGWRFAGLVAKVLLQKNQKPTVSPLSRWRQAGAAYCWKWTLLDIAL